MDRLLRDVHGLVRGWWDPGQRLLAHPGGYLGDHVVDRGERVLPAATAWWAHGLLRRGADGDGELARAALHGVAERGVGDDGEALLACAGLALVLRDHALVDESLVDGVRAVVRDHVRALRHVEPDPVRTSGAVLRAWLELEVGRWLGEEDLLSRGSELARAVAADSGVRGHVAEHVGPSCTGRTLLGLSLWAERPPVDDLAPLGRALRDELWHDLLAVWHPGLRTVVPPFSHAAGMDLRQHVGATALWLAWLVDGADPLPPLDGGPLHQAQELPLVFGVDALAGAGEDVAALAPLVRAQPARQGEWFDRVGEEVWTGWTGGDLAVGAAWSPEDRDGGVDAVPAAAVWRGERGNNAWLRLHRPSGAVEARVEVADGEVRLVHVVGGAPLLLWVGGATPQRANAAELVVDGRVWRLEGVTSLVPDEVDVPHVTAAWVVESDADGIVLTTEV